MVISRENVCKRRSRCWKAAGTHGNGVPIVKVFKNALWSSLWTIFRPKMHHILHDFEYTISNPDANFRSARQRSHCSWFTKRPLLWARCIRSCKDVCSSLSLRTNFESVSLHVQSLTSGVNGSVTLEDRLTQRGRYPGDGISHPVRSKGKDPIGGLVDESPSWYLFWKWM